MAATSRIVKDIAVALIEAAHEKGVVARVVADLTSVEAAFEAEPHLRSDLDEPSIPMGKRQEALKHALEKQVHPFALNALLLLQQQGALDELPALIHTAVSAARERAGHHEASVTSAVSLNVHERTKLERLLKAKLDGTVSLTESVDPALLGGLVVTAGDWHVDASVKGRIERLTNALYV